MPKSVLLFLMYAIIKDGFHRIRGAFFKGSIFGGTYHFDGFSALYDIHK